MDQARSERRVALDAELAEARRACKKARRAERDAETAISRQWVLTQHMGRTTLTIYVLADYVVEPAVEYLRRCGRERHWPDRVKEDLEALVLDHFMQTDAAEVAELTVVEHPVDAASMREAHQCVAEWRLVEWGRQRNRVQRVAPSSDQMLQQYEESRRQVPEESRPAARGSAAESRGREWMRRLRRRWGGRHGRLRVRDEAPVQTLHDKARTAKVGRCVRVSIDPFFGPET
jgi:hypothetical protein